MISRPTLLRLSLLSIVGLGACAGGEPPNEPRDLTLVQEDPSDLPLRGATAAELERFAEGDALFDVAFRESQGLGPLYIRIACTSCHAGDGRGPGFVEKTVIVEPDGHTPAADQSKLPWGHTVRPYLAAGALTAILPPAGDDVLTTRRLPPATFARGYIEAIDDAEIERVEAEQKPRADGISGRVHRVIYASEANPESPFHAHAKGDAGLIGRFGLKARIATVDEFTADAYQGDMGITSPLRPDEPANPDGLADDLKPGVDLDLDTINAVADYMRLLEIPRRDGLDDRGRALFDEARCSVCHVPSLKTRADYPISALAAIDAPVFSDLLLHDMGDDLADGLVEGDASPYEWRTAPLVGLRHLPSYLHDGRATSIEDAIRMHAGPGSEAADSIERFDALPPADRAALLDFVARL